MTRKNEEAAKPLVYAYGFDQVGFTVPGDPFFTPDARIEFLAYADPRSLDEANGVVMLQGIFERIETEQRYYGPARTTVFCDQSRMAERERQLWNLLRRRGWIAFLVRRIQDLAPSPNRRHNDSDLCKRVLNALDIPREELRAPVSLVVPRRDEFKRFIERFGVANTLFLEGATHVRTLASSGAGRFGIERSSTYFFLPFHSTATDSQTAKTAVAMVAAAVISYRLKMLAEVPEWLNKAVEFDGERKLKIKGDELQTELAALQESLATFEGYKRVLAASDSPLKDAVVTVLARFFGCKVDPIDEGREDLKILDAEGMIAALGEVKGTNTSVKRAYITQVDANRERSDLAPSVPGVLFINTHMDVPSLDQRARHPVAGEQVRLARTLNILIVRMLELVELMRRLENAPDRAAEFQGLLASGGGLLVVDDSGHRIETGGA